MGLDVNFFTQKLYTTCKKINNMLQYDYRKSFNTPKLPKEERKIIHTKLTSKV